MSYWKLLDQLLGIIWYFKLLLTFANVACMILESIITYRGIDGAIHGLGGQWPPYFFKKNNIII